MCSILLWFPLCLMTMYTSADVGENTGNKCASGQYISDFLSGSCAKCPKILKDCEDQEINDAVRCFNACRRIYSTTQPKKPTIATFQVRKSSASIPPATPTTQAPKITFVVEVHENLSERHFDIFKHTLILPTSSYLPYKPAGNSNKTDIIIGIAFSIAALVLVLGVCFAIFWRRKRNSTPDQRARSSEYAVVALNSRSNSNEYIEASEQTNRETNDSDVADFESPISIPSLSLEGLNNMTETYL